MPLAFFHAKTILKMFLENYRFCQKSENRACSRWWRVMSFASLWQNPYENRHVIHPLCIKGLKVILRCCWNFYPFFFNLHWGSVLKASLHWNFLQSLTFLSLFVSYYYHLFFFFILFIYLFVYFEVVPELEKVWKCESMVEYLF